MLFGWRQNTTTGLKTLLNRSGFSGQSSNVRQSTDIPSNKQQEHAQSPTNLTLYTEPSDSQLHTTLASMNMINMHEPMSVDRPTWPQKLQGTRKKLNYQKSKQ